MRDHGFDDKLFTVLDTIPNEVRHWFYLPDPNHSNKALHAWSPAQINLLMSTTASLKLGPLQDILSAPAGARACNYAMRSNRPNLTISPYHLIRFDQLIPQELCNCVSKLFKELEATNPEKHVPGHTSRESAHNPDKHYHPFHLGL